MIITIPKFKERQKATDNRHWVSIDCNIFHNKKMMPVIKADHAAFLIYLWLLSNADENGVIDLDDDSLRSNIMDAIKVKSNNYNVQKRLNLLLKHRLIEFNLPSTSVQPSFNNGSTSVQLGPNLPSTSVQLESKHSFELPETRTALHAQTNNTNNTNNTERGDVTPLAQPAQNKKRGSRLSRDWEPDEKLKQWAEKERPDLKLNNTIESFKDYWCSVAGHRGVKLDWEATFKNWVRREVAPPSHKGGRMAIATEFKGGEVSL